MKFLTKINRNYLLFISLILLVITIVGYFILHVIINSDAKENLMSKEFLIEKQILRTGEIPNLHPVIEVQKTDNEALQKPSFREVEIMNELENENEVFLEYSNKIKINNSYYLIKLRQSKFENEDLLAVLAFTLFILLLSAFVISYFVTKKMNKTVWSDFEHNLQEIENFKLSGGNEISLLKSGIEEFDRLNVVLANLTKKLKNDYLSLKEFTENASHEIQSPLAIASLNLDEILQLKLSEESFRKVITAINAIKRLSTLNQNLLLLAKIENNQFSATEIIVFSELIKSKIDEFKPLLMERNIKVNLISQSGFRVKMNPHLAEILLNNLLSNAVNHNIKNGHINIRTDQEEISICNTGEENGLTNEIIFNRFVKGNSKSHGLGLAIVKQICESHNLKISYHKNELHCFVIKPKF